MKNSERKIGKSLKFDQSILVLIEGYKSISKENFTGAVETLVLRGLENTSTAQSLTKIVRDEIRSLKQEQIKHTDRIISVLMGMTRFLGRLYSHTFSTLKYVKSVEISEIKELENHGIKKAMEELRPKISEKDNEAV